MRNQLRSTSFERGRRLVPLGSFVDDLGDPPSPTVVRPRRSVMFKANAVDAGLQQALQAFLGSGTSHVALVGHESEKNGEQVMATTAVATKGSVEVSLLTEGFTRIHRFALLPSVSKTRWIIPIGNRHSTIRGLRVCTVYAPGARFLKRLLFAVTWMGWTACARH
jgi:hypothetical protein